MLQRIALVRTNVSEELISSIIKLTGIGSVLRLLTTANGVRNSRILVKLMKETIRSSETSNLTRATRRHIAEDGMLHSHFRGNLKSYRPLPG
jgi:hypothetical protein